MQPIREETVRDIPGTEINATGTVSESRTVGYRNSGGFNFHLFSSPRPLL